MNTCSEYIIITLLIHEYCNNYITVSKVIDRNVNVGIYSWLLIISYILHLTFEEKRKNSKTRAERCHPMPEYCSLSSSGPPSPTPSPKATLFFHTNRPEALHPSPTQTDLSSVTRKCPYVLSCCHTKRRTGMRGRVCPTFGMTRTV